MSRASARRDVRAIATILSLVFLVASAGIASAEEAKPPTIEEIQAQWKVAGDTMWVIVTGCLVFFMQAGFAMVETGFTRIKNAVNICMKNLLDFCFASVVYWAIGFGLMFSVGTAANYDLFGTSGWFLQEEVVPNPDYDGKDAPPTCNNFRPLEWTVVPLECKFFFQLVFAGTAATIVSGAMAERTKLTAYMIYSVFISALIYPISGHWIWGGGWLADKGFWDFAGSTVVHSVGGWCAMVGSFILGPRIGKYGANGAVRAIPGHNIPIATLGVFILWLGWFGFNPGSTMALVPADISHVCVTTNAAAAFGAIFALFTSRCLFSKWDAGMALNGALAGLVAVTCPCYWVTIFGASCIGAIGGVLVVFSVLFFDRTLKIDDPVGAISVHGVCGLFGTLSLGLFSMKDFGATGPKAGIFYGGTPEQLVIQAMGAGAVFLWTVVTAAILFYVVKFTVGLRVSEDEELEGLDMGEHGYEAYHGFATTST